jgi:hypothetical protein
MNEGNPLKATGICQYFYYFVNVQKLTFINEENLLELAGRVL